MVAMAMDPTKNAQVNEEDMEGGPVPYEDYNTIQRRRGRLWNYWQRIMSSQAIEESGVQPVPATERTETKVINIFTLWFTISANLIPIVTGMVSTLSYGLSLPDASLVILFLSILCCTPVAYLATLGPQTGMRQMIQARFSFGYYLVSWPVLLNLATLTGFCVIISVTGGLTLSSVNNDLSPDAGIVILVLLGLVISFCGFRVLHYFERYAWLPAIVAIIVATGCGGSDLRRQVKVESPTAAPVLSFAALVAGFLVPWAALASDFATYMPGRTPASKIFAYTYGGLFLPTVPLMILGAAIGGAVPNVPSWQAGYDRTSIGGVLAAMLQPARGFGKFLIVMLAFSLVGNLAATMYAITLNLQLLVPWFTRVPRAPFAVVIAAIVIPVSIEAAKSFFVSLENFIGLIGYWAAAFVAVVVIEHVWFRKSDSTSYAHEIWDSPKSLPLGIAAVTAPLCSVALIAPCMAQVWYTGPIGRTTGDLGFEMSFVITGLLYLPFRTIEKRLAGR